jgi:hypothetical protein
LTPFLSTILGTPRLATMPEFQMEFFFHGPSGKLPAV